MGKGAANTRRPALAQRFPLTLYALGELKMGGWTLTPRRRWTAFT